MGEPLWHPSEIEGALGLPLARTLPPVTGISIDSRTLEPGDIFVAIKGERTDGNNFVDAALTRGASAAIVSQDFKVEPSLPSDRLLQVADPLEALNSLARASRARNGGKVVAVTGSVGKTGTKEMLRTMLGAKAAVHASEKSYNNLWGVPLSLARMPAASDFGVFEIGMNHAGEITPLSHMVRPHVAVITWVAPVHMEFFDSVSAIADAKAEVFDGLEPGGTVVLPAENEHYQRLAGHANRKGVKVIAFGDREWAAARLISFQPVDAGSKITADILGNSITFTLAAPGRHLAANAVGALGVVTLLGADLVAAAESLAYFHVPEGRGRQHHFETEGGPVLVIDETYNANPASMVASLQVLGLINNNGFRRRIAVLGDMLELGHGAARFHAELASAIDTSGIDLVFCAGSLMTHLYERLPPYKRGGIAKTSEALTATVLESVQGGDVVMIKGSLGSRMGPLADALRSRLTVLNQNEQGQNAA